MPSPAGQQQQQQQLACEHCLSVVYCSAACKAAHQPRHRPRECIELAARSLVQLESTLQAVEGVTLPGWAWELPRKERPPTPAELQRLQRTIALMRTTFGADSPPSTWPLMYMALATQVQIALQASAASTARSGRTPAFVVSMEPQAPVELYQDPHATEEAARLQREIGPILAELKEAVAQVPLRTKSENDYAHVLLTWREWPRWGNRWRRPSCSDALCRWRSA